MSDPAVEAAKRASAHDPHHGVSLYDIAEIRVNAAREALKPIRELHRRCNMPHGAPYCLLCKDTWPCATARLAYTSEELGEQR